MYNNNIIKKIMIYVNKQCNIFFYDKRYIIHKLQTLSHLYHIFFIKQFKFPEKNTQKAKQNIKINMAHLNIFYGLHLRERICE